MSWRQEFIRELVEWRDGDPTSWADVVEFANDIDVDLDQRCSDEARCPEGRRYLKAMRRSGYALADRLARDMAVK